MKTNLSLCGSWKLAVLPHKDRIECSCAKEIYDKAIEVIPATVPGNLELDLYHAHKVDDLFFGTNPDKIRRYTEKLHCWYFRNFNVSKIEGEPILCFEGLDCYADVFVNGIKVASYDNMLIKQTCSISDVLHCGENEILVHIKPAIIEALNYEYPFFVSAGLTAYEQIFVRKPAHMYGWDIMPRYLSAGIWRPVYISFEQEEQITEIYLNPTLLEEDVLTLDFQYVTKCDITGDIRLKLRGSCKDHVIEEEIPMVFPLGRKKFQVKNPYLWYPRGYGDPNQYEFELSLVRDGVVLDKIEFLQGLRTVKLDFTDTVENGEGEFVFVVNNTRVYAKGSNWVPADPFHSRDKERIPHMIRLAEECHCNMLRCWGGNVYEDDLFYELCDKAGIMVWQDFCFACAKYPQDTEFLERVRTEAIQVVKRLRAHACLALWSGDNECDLIWIDRDSIVYDPNTNALSRSLLAWVVKQYDPAKTYLSSSPYVNPTLAAMGNKWKERQMIAPEWHHYLWTNSFYKNHIRMKGNTKFVSEFGAMGAPSPESLKKYISPEKLWPFDENNDEWLMHSTQAVPELGENTFRIKLFFDQINNIFDENAKDLKDFAVKSQIVQGELLKYYIELFRARKWSKTGILWWNLIDGWPQFSDAVVDYYYDKKKAFYDIQASQQDICLMMTESDDGECRELVVANDTLADAKIGYKVKDVDSGEVLAEGAAIAAKNSSTVLNRISVSEKTRFLLIEWQGNVSGKNHYLDIQENTEKISLERYMNWLIECGLYTEWVEKIQKW